MGGPGVTPNLGLYKPGSHEGGNAGLLDGNLDTLDAWADPASPRYIRVSEAPPRKFVDPVGGDDTFDGRPDRPLKTLAAALALVNASGGVVESIPAAVHVPTGTLSVTHDDVEILGNGSTIDASALAVPALILGSSAASHVRMKARGLTVKAGVNQDAVRLLRASRCELDLRAFLKGAGTAYTIDGASDTGAPSDFYNRLTLQSTQAAPYNSQRPYVGTGLKIVNAATLNVFERADLEFIQDGIVIGGGSGSQQDIFLAPLVQNVERYGIHALAGATDCGFFFPHIENVAQAVTVDPAADTLTLTHAGTWAAFANDTPIQVLADAVPGGLVGGGTSPANNDAAYYVVNSGIGGNVKAFQLATSIGGVPVDITDAGTNVTVYWATAVQLDATIAGMQFFGLSGPGMGKVLTDLGDQTNNRETAMFGLDFWRFQNLIFEYVNGVGCQIDAKRWSRAAPSWQALALRATTINLFGSNDLVNPAVAIGSFGDATLSRLSLGAPVVLADGANVATNCRSGVVFQLSTSNSRNFTNPTNRVAGRVLRYIIVNGGAGPITPTWGGAFLLTNGVGPTIGPGKARIIEFYDIDGVNAIYETFRSGGDM